MILAVDYGTRRIGTAFAETDTTVAFRGNVIFTKSIKESLEKILEEIKRLNADKLVIGVPLGLEGKATQMSNEIELFIENLQKESNIEIIKWNEAMTSLLSKINLGSRSNRENVNSESARIILQEYLDNQTL